MAQRQRWPATFHTQAHRMNQAAVCLESLYETVGPNLLAYLRRGTQDADTAQDLLHETFCQALRNPDRLAQAASPRAWLFAIARNVAMTARRRRRATRPLTDDLPAATPGQDARLETLRQAIEALPAEQRETLELRLRDALRYDEIAEVLRVPVGTVRSRLHNAVARLRDAMTADES